LFSESLPEGLKSKAMNKASGYLSVTMWGFYQQVHIVVIYA